MQGREIILIQPFYNIVFPSGINHYINSVIQNKYFYSMNG